LHLDRVARHAGELQAVGECDALAFLVYVDRIEERVEVGLAVAVEVFKAAEVNLDALPGDAVRQAGDDAALALRSREADPSVAVRVGDREGLQADLLAEHFDEPRAEHVRRLAALAAV